MATGDEVLAVAAAHRLGFVRTDAWPMVAAHLLARGHGGEATAELAGLPEAASGWLVDQIVPRVLSEIGADVLNVERAGDVMARLLARGVPPVGHPVIRALAPLAAQLDYPDGRIGQAYFLEEWLDCECHEGSEERRAADDFEAELRRLPPLLVSDGLLAAIVGDEQPAQELGGYEPLASPDAG